MAEQVRAQRVRESTNAERSEVVSEEIPQSDTDKLKADLDALLDELDETLMENAETFVKDFVQKGGE